MAKSGITWAPGRSPADLARRIETEYGVERHVAAAGALARVTAVAMEGYAKANAPWQDRTANARQSLFYVVEIGTERVVLYLSHGMEYGVFLEVCNQGRFAIILPTLQAHYQQVLAAVRRLYS